MKIAQEVAHQVDMHDDDRLFWVTDLGWIMGPWEIVGALAAGGTVVLSEGAPDYPAPDRLWSIVERHDVTILGVSPTLIRAVKESWPGTAPVPRLKQVADPRLHRRAMGPGIVALVFRARRRRTLSDHQYLGRDGGRRLPAISLADHAPQALLAGRAGAGDGRRCLRRGGQAAQAGRRRAGRAPRHGQV